jgi:hypothetical protein
MRGRLQTLRGAKRARNVAELRYRCRVRIPQGARALPFVRPANEEFELVLLRASGAGSSRLAFPRKAPHRLGSTSDRSDTLQPKRRILGSEQVLAGRSFGPLHFIFQNRGMAECQ